MPSAATRNPLFLRDEELDTSLELLTSAHLGLVAAIRPLLDREGLQLDDFTLLFLLSRRPGLSMTELHQVSGITKQSLSRHVASLAARSLVEVVVDESDRRLRRVRLTDRAMATLEHPVAVQRSRLKKAFGKVGVNAVEGFREVLQGMAGSVPQRSPRPAENGS
ncbi:MAG: MarR family transcriptional regulator [Geminicoccaceae bacterium]|nr:MarR family transcriptional regulator [Geminicoccaceae bacterium]MCB9942138.1 MarR family transcriptional regulator [Geminicoccaceae bacterium]